MYDTSWATTALIAAAFICLLIFGFSRGLSPTAYLVGLLIAWGLIPNLRYMHDPSLSAVDVYYADPGKAVSIEFTAIVGLTIGYLIARRVVSPPASSGIRETVGLVRTLRIILVAFILGSIPMILQASAGLGLSKVEYVTTSRSNYLYALIGIVVLSLVLIVPKRLMRTYWVAFAAYVIYCLLARERDFVFLTFAMVLGMAWAGRIHLKMRTIVLFGAIGVVVSAVLASIRGTSSVIEAALGGPVAFVDRTVADPSVAGRFAEGFNPLAGLSRFLSDDAEGISGARNLVEAIRPGSRSGFGFSLFADFYLAFGLFGVLVGGVLVAFAIERLARRVNASNATAYFSVFVFIVLMYGLRNEARYIVSSLAYAGAFYFLVLLGERLLGPRFAPARAESHQGALPEGSGRDALERPEDGTTPRSVSRER